jgi:hypothetical protein
VSVSNIVSEKVGSRCYKTTEFGFKAGAAAARFLPQHFGFFSEREKKLSKQKIREQQFLPDLGSML